MLEKEILIGGEESGGVGISRHLPERDGLLNSLLLAQVMADEGKTLGELVAALQAEFGEHQYGRIDMHIDDRLKQAAIARAGAIKPGEAFAGLKVLRVETLDGIKFFLENPDCAGKKNAAETWLLLRASGTEPLLRVYCESCSVESVSGCLRRRGRLCWRGSALEGSDDELRAAGRGEADDRWDQRPGFERGALRRSAICGAGSMRWATARPSRDGPATRRTGCTASMRATTRSRLRPWSDARSRRTRRFRRGCGRL